jgi:hypothetical protein
VIATTRIPTHRNDGSRVSKRELKAILKRVRLAFNGFSLESPSLGAWIAEDGEVYEEDSQKLEVVVSPERVNEARKLFISIGKEFGQRAIFFEVREGGEIIGATSPSRAEGGLDRVHDSDP